jgi:hypothetical protein
VGRKRALLLVGAGFFGILGFKGSAKNLFDARAGATGKALVDERLEVGGGRLAA